ncbi:MAG: saccharopine dehydrogenase, partial [Cyanobacteria bacterium J06635_13]
ASSMVIDVEQPNPLQGIKPHAVLAVVNDPNNYLLMDAVQNGIPYLDVTRWTERFKEAENLIYTQVLQAPVLLFSGWMGGIASVIAIAASQQLDRVNSIKFCDNGNKKSTAVDLYCA